MNTPQAQAAPSPTLAVQPAAQAGAEIAPVVPAPGSITIDQIDTENLSLDQLNSMFGEGKTVDIPMKGAPAGEQQQSAPPAPVLPTTPPAPVPPVAPVVPPPVAPAPEPVPGAPVVPPAAPVAPVVPVVDDAELSKRYRFDDPKDQKIASLRRGGMDWKDAIAEVERQETAAAGIVQEPVQSAAELLAENQTKLDELKIKRLDAAKNESLDNEDLAQLEIDIAETSGRVAVLEVEKRNEDAKTAQAQAEQTQRTLTAREQSQGKAKAKFQDLAIPTSPLSVAVNARIEAMKNPNHPDHAVLFADNAPLIIANEVADEMGIAGITPAPTPSPVVQPAVPGQQVPVQKVASPVPGNLGTVQQQQSTPMTVEKAREMSLEELDAGFGAKAGSYALL